MHIIFVATVLSETKCAFSSNVYLHLHASSNLGPNLASSIATCTQYIIATLNKHKQAHLLVKVKSTLKAHNYQPYV